MGDKIRARRFLNQLYINGQNCGHRCPDEECSKFNVQVVCGGNVITGERYTFLDTPSPVPCNVWKKQL